MKTDKIWEFIGYLTLAGLIIGQIAYLVSDVIILIRSFAINQPTSDKVKNIAMTAICLGVIIVKIFCETP